MNLVVKQPWVKHPDNSRIESYKSALVDDLNAMEIAPENTRWSMTKITEGDAAYLMYDEKPVATFVVNNDGLMIESNDDLTRSDDLLSSIRDIAAKLQFFVYSNDYNGALVVADPDLALDFSYINNNKKLADFFEKSDFYPRYTRIGKRKYADGQTTIALEAPFYGEHKRDGSIHILNTAMMMFLWEKEDQTTNREFSYKVADSMNDFAKKYNQGLVPKSFYANYGQSTKIINATDFDIRNIRRKVFIDPYIWDFDTLHEQKFYTNREHGYHLMDKVRKGETLDDALRRVLDEEFQLGDDYVGAWVFGIEFDRDREGVLTPRLKINVYVHGMENKRRNQSYDWVSIKKS